MNTWLELGLSNALAATVLALVAWAVTRMCRRPQVVFAAWVVVLAKLMAPPLLALPLESLRGRLEYFAAWDSVGATAATDSHPPYAASLPADDVLARALLAAADDSVLNIPPGADLPDVITLPSEEDGSEFDASPAPAEFAGHEISAQVALHDLAPAPAKWNVVNVLLAVWLLGSSLWFVVAAKRILRFRHLLRLARPAPWALEAEVRALAKRMRLARVPQVCVVRRHISPLVWAMTARATIVLPAELLGRLTPQERATLLAHELAHLKRRDHLVRLLELAALGLFWWHPVAWWARRNAEQAAEQCCDAQVIELFPAQARAYALALWTTVDFLSDGSSPLPVGASGFSQARHVQRRMEMILATNYARGASRPLRLLILATGLTVLPLSLRSLWAEPAAPVIAAVDEAASAEPAVDEQTPAEPADPVVAEEEVDDQDDQPVGPREEEEHLGRLAVQPATIEQRLDRLEKLIQALAQRGQSPAAQKAGPHEDRQAYDKSQADPFAPKIEAGRRSKPATKGKSQRGHKRPDDDEPLGPTIERGSDATVEIERFLADGTRQAATNLELAKTNLARYEAAARQVEAVKKAFEADTVNVDQLLEAQRRVAEAHSAYIRAASELSALPERSLFAAKAQLTSATRALKDAKETWKKIHEAATPGSAEEKAEAMAREQYVQFKTQVLTLLNEYQRAQSRKGYVAATPVDTGIEWLISEAARHKSEKDEMHRQAEKLHAEGSALKSGRAKAEKIRSDAQKQLERAKHEAAAAREQLETLARQMKEREAAAATAAAKAEAAAKNLEAFEAAEKANQDAQKPEK